MAIGYRDGLRSDVVFWNSDGSLTIESFTLTVSDDYDKPRFSEDDGDREYRFTLLRYGDLVGNPDFEPVGSLDETDNFATKMLALIKPDRHCS